MKNIKYLYQIGLVAGAVCLLATLGFWGYVFATTQGHIGYDGEISVAMSLFIGVAGLIAAMLFSSMAFGVAYTCGHALPDGRFYGLRYPALFSAPGAIAMVVLVVSWGTAGA